MRRASGHRMPSARGTQMNTRERVENLLRRVLQPGRLEGFPRNPDDLSVVLAVATTGLERRRPYLESEVNEALIDWLDTVCADIDHVTLRRRMVDCGFLKRTTNGSRYFLNYGRVVEVLGDPAVEVDVGAIIDGIVIEREERKEAFLRSICAKRSSPCGRTRATPTGSTAHDTRKL